MLIKKMIFFFVISGSILFFTACAGLNSNKIEWDKLNERKFYLSEFQFIQLAADKNKVFTEMKNFPVKKIMYAIAKEYNIEIDITEFNRFINSRNSSFIQTEGFIRNEKFTWKSLKNNLNNRITIIFEKDYFDESKMKLKLTAYSSDKILRTINCSFSKNDFIFTQLKFNLSRGNESFTEYDKNDYENKKSVPGLIIDSNSDSPINEDILLDIKLKIEKHINSLNQEEKEKFKHDMIDYIYKLCK